MESPDAVLPELGKLDFFFKTRYGRSRFDILPTVRFGKMVSSSVAVSRYPAAFNSDSEVFVLTLRIFDAFYDSVIRQGATPVIVVFPGRFELEDYLTTGDKPHQTLIDHFDTRGFRYVDLTGPMAQYLTEATPEDILTSSGHYSSVANGKVARELAVYLEKQELLKASRARRGMEPDVR
jgi:hypothetical protein